MAEWTPEAQEYLEGYLKQVGALAKHQGDDPEEIVAGLRDHVLYEAGQTGEALIDIDVLLEILTTIGTPEQVASLDEPLTGPSRASHRPTPAAAPPVQYAPAPTQTIVVQRSSKGCIIAVLLVLAVFLLIFVLPTCAGIMLPALSRSREAARRAACQNNLKQIAISLYSYADAHDDAYPPLADEPGRLMFLADDVFPDYIQDPQVFLCPSSSYHKEGPAAIDDGNYFYLGHVVTDEEEGMAFVEAYRSAVKNGSDLSGELQASDGEVFPPLNALVPDAVAQSEVPVLIERSKNHIPGGGNVVYLDGHVEFIRLNNKWPMTESFLTALESIDR
ncbi:MAG: DUF1559 domain-containing protein [Candidatus Hydrogenedentes bacterium]|nr:DUF1559 domain-containing protein [Candidatus Hydrogenedentota bacterium]